jgi:hypothetical protein
MRLHQDDSPLASPHVAHTFPKTMVVQITQRILLLASIDSTCIKVLTLTGIDPEINKFTLSSTRGNKIRMIILNGVESI